jgi:hypothetical protein
MIEIKHPLELDVDFKNMSEDEINKEAEEFIVKSVYSLSKTLQSFRYIRDETLLDSLIAFCHTGK